MLKFFRFLIIFLYLEFYLLLITFVLELYRIIFYSYSIEYNRTKTYRRRVLKEITSITKSHTNEFFDVKFFVFSVIVIAKYLF